MALMSRTENSGARRLIDLTAADLEGIVDQRLEAHLTGIASPPATDLLDRAGAAQFLHVSLAQLDKLIRETSLPWHWLAESKRFDRRELLDWLKNPPQGENRPQVLRRGGA
jgi:hypothetical protein